MGVPIWLQGWRGSAVGKGVITYTLNRHKSLSRSAAKTPFAHNNKGLMCLTRRGDFHGLLARGLEILPLPPALPPSCQWQKKKAQRGPSGEVGERRAGWLQAEGMPQKAPGVGERAPDYSLHQALEGHVWKMRAGASDCLWHMENSRSITSRNLISC